MRWHSGEVFMWFIRFCSTITQWSVLHKALEQPQKRSWGKNTVPLSECTLTQSSNSPLRLNCKTALSWWQLLGMILWETFVFDKCNRRQCCLASAYILRPQHWLMNDSHGRHHHSVYLMPTLIMIICRSTEIFLA